VGVITRNENELINRTKQEKTDMDDQSTITAESTEPTQEAQPEIPEPSEPTQAAQPAPVDLTALRAEIEADKALLTDKERALAAAELAQAEATHGALYARCVEAQTTLDAKNREVEEHTRPALQASNRKAGAASQLDMHRRNTPEKMQQNYGTMQRYGDKSFEVWQADLETFLQEQRQAETEHTAIFGKLMGLQGERRAAAKALEDLSWEEGRARNHVSEWRNRLAQMRPSDATPVPNQFEPILNGRTLEFSSDNSLRSDPVTRVAATRGPADSH
jgi:chromosome segregation ATPase